MMSEADWELYDVLVKELQRQGARIAELETRVESLMRQQSARAREAATFGELPEAKIVEPEPQPRCERCEKHHSAELPCAPADDWRRFGDEVTGVPA